MSISISNWLINIFNYFIALDCVCGAIKQLDDGSMDEGRISKNGSIDLLKQEGQTSKNKATSSLEDCPTNSTANFEIQPGLFLTICSTDGYCYKGVYKKDGYLNSYYRYSLIQIFD